MMPTTAKVTIQVEVKNQPTRLVVARLNANRIMSDGSVKTSLADTTIKVVKLWSI